MLAPAKLNLWLDVRGRRPDGYHELLTLFALLDRGDEVEVEPRDAPGAVLRLDGAASGVPDGAENLVVRAADAWFALPGGRAPFEGAAIRLTKQIPVGGGLGGGSSDAAAVLVQLEGLAPPAARRGPQRLLEAARALGADVPFFVLAGLGGATAALGRGRGDELTPVPGARPLDVVLVTPPWGHETRRVFAHVGERLRPPADGLERAVAALRDGAPERLRDAHVNALAHPAMRAYPAFTRFTSSVERVLGRPPCLSGSGSTLFDLPDRGEAGAVVERLRPLTPHVAHVRLRAG